MKLIRIFPEICASTRWPLGNSTLNIALGNTCTTVPSTAIASFFGIPHPGHAPLAPPGRMAAPTETSSGTTAPRRLAGEVCGVTSKIIRRRRFPVHRRPAPLSVRRAWASDDAIGDGRQDHRSICGDGDRVLAVRRGLAILRPHRPPVPVHYHFISAEVHHRFDRQRHAIPQHGPRPGLSEVRDLRLLVQRSPDAVAGEVSYHRESCRLHVLLDGCPDVSQPLARPGHFDRVVQALPSHRHQPLQAGLELAHPYRY